MDIVTLRRDGTATAGGKVLNDDLVAVAWPENPRLPRASQATYRRLRERNTETLAEVRARLRTIMKSDGEKPDAVERRQKSWLKHLLEYNALTLIRLQTEIDDLFDPDLWGRPSKSATLDKLIVIGPYPSPEFFEVVEERFGRASVLLVVDDGWTVTEDLKQHIEHIRYANTDRGMVHAKIYVAEWRGRTGRTRQLLWGSANASTNGFSRHAETLSSIAMPAAADPYFSVLLKTTGQTKGQVIEMDGGLKLSLPGFRFKSRPDPETFESWLQAGVLCHKYDPDQTFAKLSIKLKKPLPKDLVEKIFEDQQLKAESKSEQMRFPYEALGTDSSSDDPKWRMKYFVDSWLGHWTSSDCYTLRGDSFHAKDIEQRRLTLHKIANASSRQRAKWFDMLIDRMQAVADGLRRNGQNPADYFDMQSGSISRSSYEGGISKQLERQHKQASNNVFGRRFATGYVFPPVPPFRGSNSAEWSFDDFTLSICESMVRSWTKGKVQSHLCKTVRDVLKKANKDTLDVSEMSAESVRDWLCSPYNWAKHGNDIKSFYPPQPDSTGS